MINPNGIVGADLREFYSGMPLAPSPQREALNAIFYELGGAALGIALGIEEYSTYDNLSYSIGSVEGMRLLRPGSIEDDNDHRCTHHAFGVIGGAEWARPGIPIYAENSDDRYADNPHALVSDHVNFLRRQGYHPVKRPRPNDVVAYSSKPLERAIYDGGIVFHHYGVLLEGGTVVSKFGPGPVIEHPIHMVPDSFGSYATFLRKRKPRN